MEKQQGRKVTVTDATEGNRREPIYKRILQEAQQQHSLRKHLYDKIEKHLGDNACVVGFFTTFDWPVQLTDKDADMLEELLHNCCFGTKKLVLILNCPGGDALAAERIIRICRSYSKDGKFSVIVPKAAKSAATMVCLGADDIGMSSTSELGPIDPQIQVGTRYFAAHEIIEAYNDLMRKANRTTGKVDPYLQQLYRYDATQIRWVRSAQQLSESIAVKSLKTGIMSTLRDAQIKRKIKPFLNPSYTKVHGRPIYPDVAKECGLSVTEYALDSPIWQDIWHLYIRCNYLVSAMSAVHVKILETTDESYTVANPFVGNE